MPAAQWQIFFSGALPHVRSGRLRGLATTGRKRSRAVPELPTLDEAGIKGYEANAWFGIYAPARVSAGLLAKVNADVQRAVALPDVQERFAVQGAEPNPMTVGQFSAFVRSEVARWAKVVAAAGARID